MYQLILICFLSSFGLELNSASVIAENQYLGCYIDESNRKLRGDFQDFGNLLTPQICIDHCKNKVFAYAGLQYRTQCFCGDEEPVGIDKRSEGDCNTVCPADSMKKCGGTWRNSIYKTGAVPVPLTYIGCYLDESLRKLNSAYKDFSNKLNPRKCIDFCKERSYTYAGLQYRTQCYCGNETPQGYDKKPEADCNTNCPGDFTKKCGGTWRNSVYQTSSGNESETSVTETIITRKINTSCQPSETTVNGRPACKGDVIFEDHFDSLSLLKWRHVIKMEPDYPFVVFQNDPNNVYTSNGKLVIKPTILDDNEIRNGVLSLKGCTGVIGSSECGHEARSYSILPPVQSARLTTRDSFAFRYGKVEISAKLPAGDWLVPELWLQSKDEVYDPGYPSGRLVLAMSRGNRDLKLNGEDIGCKQMESGVSISIGDNVKGRTITRETDDGWYSEYHNYTVVWTPENMIFTIDGVQPRSLLPSGFGHLPQIVGFAHEATSVWTSASKIAPFDNEFYVTLGLSVGGTRNFPDNSLNSGKTKPWRNFEVKATLNFWRDKGSWHPTWQGDTSSLHIDYVKVTAL